jgi:hypothetical protein
MMRNSTTAQKDRVQKMPSSLTPGQQTSVVVEASTKHSTSKATKNLQFFGNCNPEASV